MCHVDPSRTKEVIEVLEEAIPMPEEVELVMVATPMGGMNLMIIPVETVTKGVTTTAEEGDVVVEIAIHTTTTETLTSPLRLRFSAFGFCVRLISLLKFPITYIKHFLWFGTFDNWSLGN
ncbi:hypothetical protein HID58_087920 [Brassica napus]|uniref:Uncharacterized protein n=2 Tax=Brassica TaxID=3705 RepID=A0ABQ7XUN7_BRANA|nr:hypothetical protein HID58_087920 [Brassica napus]